MNGKTALMLCLLGVSGILAGLVVDNLYLHHTDAEGRVFYIGLVYQFLVTMLLIVEKPSK